VPKGWFSRKEDEYRVEGLVSKKLVNGKEVFKLKIHGYWNGKIYLTKFLPNSFEADDENLQEDTT